MATKKHYTLLADLFRYPSPALPEDVIKCGNLIKEKYPECTGMIQSFSKHLQSKSLNEQQEYYIKTFDIQAVCFLDIGYVIFGEDYKRGEFLVNMQKEQKNADNECRGELPDHLPNVLTLISKTMDTDFAEDLAYSMTIPALKEMLIKFKAKGNIYKALLEMLLIIMEKDFAGSRFEQIRINTKNEPGFRANYPCSVAELVK